MSALKELMLRAPRLTLAVAESVTCGRVQAGVGGISGASEFFLGGVTAYTLDLKARLLGVDPALAALVNGVSAEIATQMARGVCAHFGAEVGLATTGYAEPSPAHDVAEPFAWWAVTGPAADGTRVTRCGRVACPGLDRAAAQALIADTALAELETFLRETRGG